MILTLEMAHPRKLIRHAVVALLLAANTAAGARVQPTRVLPLKKAKLPALGVYTLNDPVLVDATTSTEATHEVELEVACWVAHTDAAPADNAMDDIAEQVEAAMKADPFLSGKASEVRLVGSVMEVVEVDGRTDPTVGIIVLTYAVTYRSDIAPNAVLEEFLRVQADTTIAGGVADTAPASSEFNVRETTP